jgi:hypothetical protein
VGGALAVRRARWRERAVRHARPEVGESCAVAEVVAVSVERKQSALDAAHTERRAASNTSELFKAHTSPFFTSLVRMRALSGTPESGPSLATCEQLGTSTDESQDGDQISAARDAILQSISRSTERQYQVQELITQDEPAAARRLAYCGRQSVQLECSTCGSTDNYVPISCDLRLCPECGDSRMGKLVAKYMPVVRTWDWPSFLTATIENVESLEAVDRIRDDFNRFLDRVVPTEGETEREGEHKSWCWRFDGGEPRGDYWKQSMCGGRGSSRGKYARYEASRLEEEYVSEGRGIPVRELIRSGFYSIHVKEKPDGRFNVHIHAVVNGLYCPQSAYSAVWEDVSGAPVFHIEAIDPTDTEDLEGAVSDVIGYAVQPPEFRSVETAVAYYKELKGKRLVQPFGALHGNTPDSGGDLLCAECGDNPVWWDYCGIVDEAYDTMMPSWEEDGDRPPPDTGGVSD